MAFEGYHSPPPEQPGFFDHAEDKLKNPLHQNQSQHLGPEFERVRSRASSSSTSNNINSSSSNNNHNMRDPGYHHAQQPINDAVASAFDKADTTNAISPELLSQITSQITANVIQQLTSTTLGSQISPDGAIPQPNGAAIPPSPNPSNISQPTAHRTIHTPPTPPHIEDPPSHTSTSQIKFTHPAHNHHSPERSAPSPASLTSQTSQVSQASQPSQTSQTSHVSHASHTSHTSQISESQPKDTQKDFEHRPKGPIRLCTEQNATLVEKAWGQLYGEDGIPTARLGQLLRGIANHLIEDYEPKQSLVVTPSKLQKFYRDTAVPQETYPWQVIFDDRTSSISRLYRELGSMHHLVQEDNKYDERPDVPGLTPQGFQTWATLLLEANPDHEFERLQRVVRDMPISNADDRKDRFPKEISRRLFPRDGDSTVKEKLEKAMVTHCNIDLPMAKRSVNERSRSRRRPETTIREPEPTLANPGLERERQPYSGAPSNTSSGADDSDDTPTPQPIERERKPYIAQPGGGKIHNDVNKPTTTTAYPSSATESLKESVNPRSRAYSTSTSNRYAPSGTVPPTATSAQTAPRPVPIVNNGTRPAGYPPSSFETMPGSHNSDPHTHSHLRNGSLNRNRSMRGRSPSTTDPYRHSEPEFSTSSANASNSFPEYRDRERDYYREDPQRVNMYEMGSSSNPGRERGRYRYEGTNGSISSASGIPMSSPQPYHHSQPTAPGREHYANDEERFRAASISAGRPPPLGATPGAAYGNSPPGYYR